MSLLDRVGSLLERTFPNHVFVSRIDRYSLAEDAKVALVLARQDALAYGQVHATPERVLLAMLENEPFADKIRARRGVELEKLRECLLLTLAGPELSLESRSRRAPARLDRVMGQALERSRRGGRSRVSFGDLLFGLAATEGRQATVVEDIAVAYESLDSPQLEIMPDAASEEDETVSVWTLDDDQSTMNDVMRTLERAFGLPVRHAFHVMFTTHECGRARVGTYSAATARGHLAKAREYTGERNCPLRFHVGKA